METGASKVLKIKKEESLLLPTLAMITTALFWGLSFISTKVILNTGMPPMTMALSRFLIASMLLYPLLKRLEPKAVLESLDKRQIVISGLLGITVYFFFEATGIRYTDASVASMIMASIPIFTVFLEIFYYKNKVSKAKITGVALSVLGVFMLIGYSISHGGNTKAFLGNLLVLGACLAWVFYIAASRNLKTKYSGLALTTYQTLAGTVFLLPLALFESSQWVPITLIAALNILYLGIFCSALSYFLYLYSLSRLGPLVVSTYLNLLPVVGVIGGTLILGERISLLQAIGGGVILGGVFLVNKN
jgi:drug/metabolite transporter (DMT)-like permease